MAVMQRAGYGVCLGTKLHKCRRLSKLELQRCVASVSRYVVLPQLKFTTLYLLLLLVRFELEYSSQLESG